MLEMNEYGPLPSAAIQTQRRPKRRKLKFLKLLSLKFCIVVILAKKQDNSDQLFTVKTPTPKFYL